MSPLSLLPENAPIETARLTPKTLRLLLLLLVAIIALAGARHWSSGQKAEVDLAYNNAQAQQQALQNQAQRLQQQIADLQSAGGAAGVDTAKALIKSRIDWKKVFLALINSTEEGVTINNVQANSPQSQSTPAATPAPAVTSADVTISGITKSRAQLEALVKRLRAQDKVFTEVKLRKANQREEGDETEYSMELSLKPAGPLPAATSDPAATGSATPAPTPAPSTGGGS